MRWKIIVVNAVVVLIVGVLTYSMLAASLGDLFSNKAERKREVGRAVRAATTQLAVDALRLERWADTQAASKEVKAVYAAGVIQARQEAATAQAGRVHDQALAEPEFAKMAPALVVFVDDKGVALGRNGSTQMRGDRTADAYPSLAEVLRTGATKSDLWLSRVRQEQMLTSYAPVRGDSGEVLGALVVGTPLNDERLTRTSELTSGQALMLGVLDGGKLELVAKSGLAAGKVQEAASSPAVRDAVQSSLTSGQATAGDLAPSNLLFGAAPLDGYGDGRRAAVIVGMPASLVDSLASLLWPVFAVAGLGIVLVIVGGFLLGNYFSRPIAELEDGLLAIINGRADLRFEIEHPDLGGLVFRINSLLNALMGVAEDTTDDQGRPSRQPSPGDFQEALSVDESSVAGQTVDPRYAAELAAEPDQLYYARLFREYIARKQQLGDPVDHITEVAFIGRIQASEQEMAQKHGRVVRYRIDVRGNQVVLTAVPLPR
jgi:hypothetical protein